MLAYAIFAGLICAGYGSVIQLALTKELLPETKALFEGEKTTSSGYRTHLRL